MTRIFAILAFTTLGFAAGGCHPDEGERCNPLLFNDECYAANHNLHCVYPPNCGIAFCCPAPENFTPSTSPNCSACPAPDMGESD
jgi:hypothetical protein